MQEGQLAKGQLEMRPLGGLHLPRMYPQHWQEDLFGHLDKEMVGNENAFYIKEYGDMIY